MKRILFIFLILISISQGYSQIITNVNIQGIDCNNSTGYISITTDITPYYIIWWNLMILVIQLSYRPLII